MSKLTIEIGFTKNVFQVHSIDDCNRVVIVQKVRRAHLLAFFAKLELSLIGMEACGAAHHWARELTDIGHEIKLITPAYAKPYVKRGKNDMVDTEAICEAVTRPTMRFVPSKTASQQSILMVHKSRALLIPHSPVLGRAMTRVVLKGWSVIGPALASFLFGLLARRLVAGCVIWWQALGGARPIRS